MLKKLLRHKSKIAWISLFVLFLILVRAFENTLFYDPYLAYFKMDYTNLLLPETSGLKLFFGLLFRYALNTIISLAIIYVSFKDLDLTKFAALLYLFFFVILIAAFFIVESYYGESNKMMLFYIRRFLIQPLFLLLFLPAFYYQKQIK
ncbi:exosortase F system-associated protein [Flavobacterium sp. GT3R68]|uniref:exosortase F system-associated membrane protein n=1 Tax=Flavobacterium sp. GT3R68 TaxID=2594437 RepID=UPI000F89035F|nr:exosortase F system-associated protein [Flavobacterium sp. GT3R68]RTY90928.1 exosortase F system-associated protein [Flavobacterium sp. GSN2]TRW90491.1 exosortase F system-associated protein [Flavobacterium sp. GT3R68]